MIRTISPLIAIVLLAGACASRPAEPRPETATAPAIPTAAPAQAATAPAPPGPEATPPEDISANAETKPGDESDATKSEEPGGAVTGENAPSEGEAEAEDEKEKEEEDEKQKRVVLDTAYDDARVGEDQRPLIEAELGIVKDEALNRYVRSVALRLLRHAPPRPFDYQFQIVDQDVPNAFALPGGQIYVSRGLLSLATSEDELAGVLGHEITHAAERHASARIEYTRRMNPFAIGFIRAAKIAAYGRDQERDADRGGQLLAAKAGYDPRGIANFLRKLDAAERYEIGWARLPSFFATHPTSPERSAIAINRATSLKWTRAAGVAGNRPADYYEKIDGLIIGDDPAGGLFDEENRFVHPELQFSIRFPQGWETMNSQQAVRAVSPRRDAQAELAASPLEGKSLEEVVDAFLDDEFEGMKFRADERRKIRIGDFPAVRVEGRATSVFGRLDVSITFVLYDELVFRLTVLTLPEAANRYRGRTRSFAHSFRPLEKGAEYSLKVTRLRIALAKENETLQDLSKRTRNELELVYTGVLNGLYASTPLKRRAPIKIGIEEPYRPQPNAPKETEAAPPPESPSQNDPSESEPQLTPKKTSDASSR